MIDLAQAIAHISGLETAEDKANALLALYEGIQNPSANEKQAIEILQQAIAAGDFDEIVDRFEYAVGRHETRA